MERFAVQFTRNGTEIFSSGKICVKNLPSRLGYLMLRKWQKSFWYLLKSEQPKKSVCYHYSSRFDFLEKVHCDNPEEPTMDGDEVGSIPEFLKYTFVAPNGKTYCSNIIDLYNAMRSGQQMDPYRRFNLDRADITDRYKFLEKVIEPHGLGQGILSKIRDTMIALTPGQQLRARLIQVWGNLISEIYD